MFSGELDKLLAAFTVAVACSAADSGDSTWRAWAARVAGRAALRRQRMPLPIIALTAAAMHGDRKACVAAGMSDYVTKPFSGETLRRVLELWLGETIAADRA